MAKTYKISEVCGDWALHIPPYGKMDEEMILIFNSRNNAELVKSVLEWEDAHPNAAVPYMPTLTPPNEPLTQADVDKMHFDRVWIDYGTGECSERDGEEGVILYGKLYPIDTLDGAGLEDLLLDATGHGADTLDNPSGNYTVCRRPPEEECE